MQNQRWVVKTNLLNGARSILSTVESKVLNLVLCEARRTGTGASSQNPLYITSQMYADTFGIDVKNAYRDFKAIPNTLFDKLLYVTDSVNNQPLKTTWFTHLKYHAQQGTLEIVLSEFVADNTIHVNEKTTPCTSYQLSKVALLKSQHAMRLYELLSQYKTTHKVPKQSMDCLKSFMNINPENTYYDTGKFNHRVLKKAAIELKERLGVDLSIDMTYNGLKKGFVEIKILSMGIQSKRIIKKEPHNIGRNFERLTDQQVITFACKLFYDEEIKNKLIYSNETDLEFFQRLLKSLQDVDIVKEIMPYLLNHEYKPG